MIDVDTVEAPELKAAVEAEDPDELVIQIGDEPAPETADDGTHLVKHLRERTREQAKEIARLRAQSTPPAIVEIGPKPTAESVNWDDDAFADAMAEWVGKKAKADEAAATQRRAAETADAAIADDRARYTEKKTRVTAADYQDAEDAVQAALGDASGVIISAALDPTMVVLALGRHPAKLAELAKLAGQPIKLIAAVARLEGSIKVGTKKPPQPETIVRGSAPISPPKSDAALAKLEAEAERTGDRSKVQAYRRELKAR